MAKLVDYRLQRGQEIGPVAATMYEYILASNGVFIRAKREGLEVCFPVGSLIVRGLAPCQPYFKMDYPRVPERLVEQILEEALNAGGGIDKPIEILFYLAWNGNEWKLNIPEQHQSAGSCYPKNPQDPAYQQSLIELHSHHCMQAYFSGTDDKDEQGFKVYCVLGNIFDKTSLRVRVGVYGYFWEIDAHTVFDLPFGVYDANEPEYELDDPTLALVEDLEDLL